MKLDPLLGLLQFADGLFPSGGYAHSFGLEYDVQAGAVRDLEGVQAFLQSYLEGTAGPCDAVAVISALTLCEASDFQGLLDLDQTLEAMKPVAEFREASRQMGRQMLRVATALSPHPLIVDFFAAVESGTTPGHHPLVFGMLGGAFRWSPQAAALAYLYSTASVVVSAAVRLLPLGQINGQRALWAVAPLIIRLARDAEGKTASEMWSFAPGIDIAGMRHATLEARLFRS